VTVAAAESAPATPPGAPETSVEAPPAEPRPAAPAAVEPGTRRTRAAAPRPVPRIEPEPSTQETPDDGTVAEAATESEVTPREPEPPPPPIRATVGAGTRITLELLDGVSSQTAAVGAPVRARVVETIRVDGRAAIPAGSTVTGRVTEAKALRKVGGQAHLAIAFDRLERDGGGVPLEAYWARTGRSETGKDAATIAAGAVIGTVLGNQAKKRDRGKAIGAIVGAGVGTAIAASTEGETVELATGDVLELTLRSDVELLLRP